MSLKLKICGGLFVLGSFSGFSQETDSIATKVNKLDEVVVTGQYNPQSVKKSVFEVKVITRADIDRQAGNNLADILNQTLNINIIPNASTGKSGVQLFGLDSQYFKILIDNIPVVNDEGLGNNTDLTQINLDDIQQIEIVEGSMGVDYGANAVSGIINIITKKSSLYKWEITPYIQEETVGKEYNLADKGRHIQSIKIGHNFNEKFYANALFTRNDFKGFWNGRMGENYSYNDGLRGYEWLPKEQLNAKSLLAYTTKNYRLFYKFEFFKETTDRYDSTVQINENPATATSNPVAKDEIFTSTRYYHHLNASGKLSENGLNYDISLSYQEQTRDLEKYNYRIRQQEHFGTEKFEYESRKVYYSKGFFSNFLKNETFNLQAGYEVNSINGYVSSEVGMFNGENIRRELNSYDFYTSSEINFNNKFSIRPGIRALMSSKFDTQAALSLSAKYAFDSGYELRAIVGTAPRLPNFDELYTYMVDVNHNIQGNPNLNPEQGKSIFVHLKKDSKFNDAFTMQNKLSGWFMDVKDRIEMIIIPQSTLVYQYNNIDVYKTWGLSLTNSAQYGNFTGNFGLTFSGISKVVDSSVLSNDDFLYAFQINANTSYTVPKWGTIFSAYVKYNGPQYQFVEKNGAMERGKQNPFTWLDATVKKSFLNKKLEATVGARNLLDITTVNTGNLQSGAHEGSATNLLLGYGRSYFLKLLYKINI